MTSLLFELWFCPWPTAWQRLGQLSSWMNPGGHWRVSHPTKSNLLIWQPSAPLMAANAIYGAFKGNNCKIQFPVVTNQNKARWAAWPEEQSCSNREQEADPKSGVKRQHEAKQGTH